MKKIILKLTEKWNKNLATFAIEKGITSFLTNAENAVKLKELAKLEIIGDFNGADKIIGKDCEYLIIKDKSDEIKAVETARQKPVIIKLSNWKVIPIENIIAQTDNIIVEIDSFEEAKLCSGILEKGVKSFVVETKDLNELSEITNYFHSSEPVISLIDAEIVSIKHLPVTDRVCIDSCNLMSYGEGFLIGSSSQCLFLTHSESIENPYVAARPFRVNAGAVHSYIMIPGNKTKYLSEIKAGDELLTVSFDGKTKLNVTGRVKIEKRPMLLVKAKYQDNEFSVVLQNAETVNLTSSEGKPVSVSKLKQGDKVKCYVENSGRHFGMSINET
ncbi:3-dehydroquinate synthase II, partial [Candidatus Dependentiae bacterium]|nr:3-dehydroquinate synthase II [Candidatus Dependentiae bacterium]